MKKPIPKVSLWHTIRNTFKIVKNPLPVITEIIAEKGNTFTMHMGGGQRAIFTADPEIAQYVMQKNNRNYRKSEIQTKLLARYAGNGLLTSEGDYWLRQRRLIQPGFHRAKLAALSDIMLIVVQESFKDLDQLAESNEVFDISDEMTKMAFNVVAKSLFTTSVSDKELAKLSNNIQEIQEFIIKKLRQPYLGWWFYLTQQHTTQLNKSKESKSIILQIIQERRESGNEFDDLLDMLLSSRYEDTNEGMNDTQLLDEALILFVAGHETSANALAWAFYLLTKYPEAADKIREEYQTVVGDRKIEFSDFPKLTYTSQVIQETMRIYPPAWITDRLANTDDEFKGITIPKDNLVALYIYGLHHSKELWDEPEKFKPERFTKENIKAKPAFAYMPFGGGPRLCIGNNFAMMEMQMVVIELLKRYDFFLEKNQNIEAMPLITLQPKYGIKMRMRKRVGISNMT